MLPLGGPPALQPDGTVVLDEATKDAVVSSSSVLSAHGDVPLTIAATAETVDALDPTTIEAVEERRGRPRSSSVTPYVRLHPSEWVASGLEAELGQQFDRGTRALVSGASAPRRARSSLPTTGSPPRRRGTCTGGASASMVVPDDALERPRRRGLQPDAHTTVRVARQRRHQKQSPPMAPSLRTSGSTGDPVIDANHLVADLSVLYFDDPPDERAATFVLPDDRPIDSRFLDALLGGSEPDRRTASCDR